MSKIKFKITTKNNAQCNRYRIIAFYEYTHQVNKKNKTQKGRRIIKIFELNPNVNTGS